jgi:hypothetical protein
MSTHSDINIDVYDINAWCSIGVVVFLIALVTLFGFKWRHESIPIMQVLTILLVN